MSRVVIIRDYAYPETDKRFHGVYSASGAGLSDDEEVPEIDLEHDDEESEYEDLEDEKLWEWIWTYQSSKQISENTGSLQKMEASQISGSVLPTFDSLVQKCLANTDIPPFNFTRVKTIFPFVKGTDYEMSLDSGDELLIIDFKKEEMSQTPIQERWSSIDGMPSDNEERKQLNISLDPPVEPFCGDIKQFLGFNKKYGDGWVTALKIRVYGNWTKQSAKIVLRDIGLVPGNYIEPVP